MARENVEQAMERWEKLRLLQTEYADFSDFLYDGMALLGFTPTEIHYEIGQWLQFGPQYLMVQAQRGQAKTTVTALFAVWNLIHNPKTRILIVSAGGALASQISNWCIRIIGSMSVLDCLQPDPSAGDRTSVEAFDIHHSLRGDDKSPSIACFGITASMSGFRADLLIADDIETPKNSETAHQRERLVELTKEFSSINSNGRIVYLGTPQSRDSVYNGLPARGFAIRIWPGRIPSAELLAFYGEMLAPSILKRIADDPTCQTGYGLDGKQGAPTDPALLDDAALCKKELDQGPSYFQLQHMLCTALNDAQRFPLKLKSCIFMNLTADSAPLSIHWGPRPDLAVDIPVEHPMFKNLRGNAFYPASCSGEMGTYTVKMMYIDPAGGGANADETGYVVLGLLAGNVFVLDAGGVPGGYDPADTTALADIAKSWKVQYCKIEKNLGHGAFKAVFDPILKKVYPECGSEEDYASGMKEKRICDTLEPVTARHSLIINAAIIDAEVKGLKRYGVKAVIYSLFHQIANMQPVRNALMHDDRVDGLAGGVRNILMGVALDQEEERKAAEEAAHAEWMRNPLGNGIAMPGYENYGATNIYASDYWNG